MIKKQTKPQLCQLFTSPCINIETLKRGLSLGLPALIFHEFITRSPQCFGSAMLLVLFSLTVIWGWLIVSYTEILGLMMYLPPSLSFCLFFPFLEILIGVVLEEQGFPHLSFKSSSQRECGFIFLSPPLHLEQSPSIVLTVTDTKVAC